VPHQRQRRRTTEQERSAAGNERGREGAESADQRHANCIARLASDAVDRRGYPGRALLPAYAWGSSRC
jgi:hypothetical protein